MSGSLLLRRRGPPLTTPVPGERGALPVVKFVVMLIVFLGLAWASSHLAALPVPERTEPIGYCPTLCPTHLDDASRRVEHCFDPGARLRGGAEVWGEQDQLARVRAGEVVLGLLGRAIPT